MLGLRCFYTLNPSILFYRGDLVWIEDLFSGKFVGSTDGLDVALKSWNSVPPSAEGAEYDSQGQALSGAKRVAPG